MMTTPSGIVRLLAALTNLLLSQPAKLRQLQADSQDSASSVTELLDQIASRMEQNANEAKGRLSQALAEEGHTPVKTTAGDTGQPRRGVDLGPRTPGFSYPPGTNGIPREEQTKRRPAQDPAPLCRRPPGSA